MSNPEGYLAQKEPCPALGPSNCHSVFKKYRFERLQSTMTFPSRYLHTGVVNKQREILFRELQTGSKFNGKPAQSLIK